MAGAIIKNNFNKGELDPEADERIDLKPWRSAVQLGLNVEFWAKGGFSQRPALASKSRLRRKLERVVIANNQVSALSGGDLNALLGTGEIVVPTPLAGTGEVLRISLAAFQKIAYFDVLGFKSATVSGGKLSLEVSADNINWIGAGAFYFSSEYRSRRFKIDRNIGYIRLVVSGSVVTDFVMKSVGVFVESDALSQVSLFARGDHILALSDQNGIMFRNGVALADLPIEVTHEQIKGVTSAGALATILLFNNQFRPIRVKKQGDAEWNVDHPNFENVPELSASSALSGATGPMMSDKNGWPACGAFFQARLALGGFLSAPTTYIMSRLGHPYDFQQEFGVGTDAEVTPDAGVEDTLDSDEEEVIRRLYVGRHFQIFTDMGEYYHSTRSIDATKPRNVVSATRVGIAKSPRVVSVDGGTFFGQGGGGAIEDFFYSDVEQSYNTTPATLWGAHLIGDVVSLARRRSEGTRDANLIFAVNEDGSAVEITMMRKQEVFAMARIATKGKIRSVAVDKNRKVFMVVERTRNGITDNWLEHWDATRLLDASKLFRFDDPETLIGGLEHLEGETVWAMVDGTPEGPHIVRGSHIELSRPGRLVEVGYLYDMRIKDMPHRSRLPDGSEDKKPKRINELYLAVQGTGELDVRICDENRQGEWREVIMNRHDRMQLDTPLLDRLVTGEVKVSNLRGFYDAPFIELRRPVPCPVFVKSMSRRVV